MTPRKYQKGDVLFRKGDVANEMFLMETGLFLVTEIGIEIPPGRVMVNLVSFAEKPPHPVSRMYPGWRGADDHLRQAARGLFPKPEFGYYFLRLSSDRLMENFARLESIIEQDKAPPAAAKLKRGAKLYGHNQALGANLDDKTPGRGVFLSFREMRARRNGKKRENNDRT